jgi:allantoate deiminase
VSADSADSADNCAVIAARIMHRADELAALSADPACLTRTFLSPEHRRTNERVLGWMREAGMSARVDAIGNVVGRYEGVQPGLPALVLGSHLDTVRDAGRYDGMLGVISAIECVAQLHARAERLGFALEVVGFGDEEGVRFGSTLLGSRALAGTFDFGVLAARDSEGVTLAEALRAFALDPAAVGEAARMPAELLAYVELHIEQGPVLERAGLPVGCVSSISGATRLEVRMSGHAGHAGTVPMGARRDALAAAAEAILAVERRCAQEPGLVGTVGRIEALPGAVNVIPGQCRFTIDIRAPDDVQRQRALAEVTAATQAIGARRDVGVEISTLHESNAVPCAPWLMEQIDRAIAAQGVQALHLPSGAGHDAMAMAAVTAVGMIFVRCAGGVSHHPDERISAADAGVGAATLSAFVRAFTPRARALA